MGLNPKKETIYFQIEPELKSGLYYLAKSKDVPMRYILKMLIKSLLNGDIDYNEMELKLKGEK